MMKIARTQAEPSRGSATSTKVARVGHEGRDAARSVSDAAADTSAAADDGRRIARRSAADAGELGNTALELLAEQTRHSLHAATAIGRAVNWTEIVEAQREFVGESFDRMKRLGESYRAMLQAGMTTMSASGRR
jgi:hypothetical protein